MAYKERVPVCGAILISQYWDKVSSTLPHSLNPTHRLTSCSLSQVLLVKGWQKGASWSFPRGKINKEETEGMCAVREASSPTPLARRPTPARRGNR
jgi:mRNA-decapping enzyme subunit 2